MSAPESPHGFAVLLAPTGAARQVPRDSRDGTGTLESGLLFLLLLLLPLLGPSLAVDMGLACDRLGGMGWVKVGKGFEFEDVVVFFGVVGVRVRGCQLGGFGDGVLPVVVVGVLIGRHCGGPAQGNIFLRSGETREALAFALRVVRPAEADSSGGGYP